MFKSLSRAGNHWLFIKLIASAYSFWINYCFTSKYTSSSNTSCIRLYLNEYVISTIINFSPLRAGKCFVEFFFSILRAESGLFSICSYALFCLFSLQFCHYDRNCSLLWVLFLWLQWWRLGSSFKTGILTPSFCF